ncbi:polyphosphate polymerase domain-containing protein [Marinilabiliaceae bacterium ANBcel2]|nr:polyphosphate polymerase domain-containing protein [Marinilabiliaceae bacterium ANBcel2]
MAGEKLRYERKYLVPNEQMEPLRKRIAPFVVPDENTIPNKFGVRQYTVRSIYLDSRNMECYGQKDSGIKLRRKLRIRGYNSYDPNNKVVLEIKRKIGNRIKKHRANLYYRDLKKAMVFGNLEEYIITNGSRKPVDDAKRFFYHLKKKQYMPTNIIAYEREAFFGKMDSGVRLTFDKNIRSKGFPGFDALYQESDLKRLFDSHFVLEIKYFTDEMPLWARSVVQEFKLRNDAISKYTIGYDVAKYNRKLTY